VPDTGYLPTLSGPLPSGSRPHRHGRPCGDHPRLWVRSLCLDVSERLPSARQDVDARDKPEHDGKQLIRWRRSSPAGIVELRRVACAYVLRGWRLCADKMRHRSADSAGVILVSYVMPGRVGVYLRRLAIEYRRDGNYQKHELATSTPYRVQEGTDSQNFGNGNSIGHDLHFFVTEEFLEDMSLSAQRDLASAVCGDLNEVSEYIGDEYWNSVHIDLVDENDSLYQGSISPKLRSQPNPNVVSFWRNGEIRLFVSHRDVHKRKALDLQRALDGFGVSSFVAHETIEPNKEWAREITLGLETMEVMLVFLTNDFSESVYTNQEVGFALGRNSPIIALKLEKADPPGFISHKQALRGSLDNPAASAIDVWKLIVAQLGQSERIQASAVSAFVASVSYIDAMAKFDRLSSIVSKLTDEQALAVVNGYNSNPQLKGSGYLSGSNRLVSFLQRTTGRQYGFEGGTLKHIRSSSHLDDDIPF
jgi:hypothetical protein